MMYAQIIYINLKSSIYWLAQIIYFVQFSNLLIHSNFGKISNLLNYSYTNKKYWHGSSVRGTVGLTRSLTVPANQKSIAQAQTLSIDNNHAYWRVDENMK